MYRTIQNGDSKKMEAQLAQPGGFYATPEQTCSWHFIEKKVDWCNKNSL